MKKEKISNPDLEQLIKQSFLELDFENSKNQILMNTVSNSIFSVKVQLFQIINALKLFIGIGLISIVGYFFLILLTQTSSLKRKVFCQLF